MVEAKKIFISYRRADNPDFVARIRDQFIPRYGRENVFMDFDSIPAFVPFGMFIQEKVQECDVLVAIIGSEWIKLLQEKEQSSQEDFVRIEIALALKIGKLVAPLCIKGAPLPSRNLLPPELHALLDINVARLDSDTSFYDKIPRIMDAVEHALMWRKGQRPKDETPEIKDDTLANAVQHIIEEVESRPLPPATTFLNRLNSAMLIHPEDALEVNPRNDSAYAKRGKVRFDRGDLDGAIADYTMALRLHPKSDYYQLRSEARRAKGDVEGANADHKTAQDTNSGDGTDTFYAFPG